MKQQREGFTGESIIVRGVAYSPRHFHGSCLPMSNQKSARISTVEKIIIRSTLVRKKVSK